MPNSCLAFFLDAFKCQARKSKMKMNFLELSAFEPVSRSSQIQFPFSYLFLICHLEISFAFECHQKKFRSTFCIGGRNAKKKKKIQTHNAPKRRKFQIAIIKTNYPLLLFSTCRIMFPLCTSNYLLNRLLSFFPIILFFFLFRMCLCIHFSRSTEYRLKVVFFPVLTHFTSPK